MTSETHSTSEHPSTSSAPKRLRRYIPDPEGYGPFYLTERDLALLRAVHRYRYLLADHLRALAPGSDQQITRRLAGLFHHKYLARLTPPPRIRLLQKTELQPITIYALASRGANTLLEHGLPRDGLHWDPDYNLRTAYKVLHELMVSNFRVTLDLAAAQSPFLTLETWRNEEELRDSVSVPDPRGRQRYATYPVSPDAYAALSVNGQRLNIFLEADRNTEEHTRIDRKLRTYWHYLTPESPYWKRYQHPERRLVLFVTTSELRLRNMLLDVARLDPKQRGLAQFWFTTQQDFTVMDPRTILAPIWRTVWHLKEGHDTDRKSLLS